MEWLIICNSIEDRNELFRDMLAELNDNIINYTRRSWSILFKDEIFGLEDFRLIIADKVTFSESENNKMKYDNISFDIAMTEKNFRYMWNIGKETN